MIELIVVIGVIAVLMSILLPALASARRVSWRLKSASNVRSLTQLVLKRAEDNRGAFPTIDPEAGPVYMMPFTPGNSLRFGGSHWIVAGFQWPAPYEFDERELGAPAMLASPPATAEDIITHNSVYTHYRLTSTVIGDPALWGDTPIDEDNLPRYRRGVRIAEIAFPAQKGLMWDAALNWLPRDPKTDGPDLADPTPVAAADGSVKNRVPAEMTDGVLCHDPDQRAWVEDGAAMHNTPDGVRGRDW